MTEDVPLLRRLFRDVPACRVATVRADGGPHVAARWFVWLEDAVWVSTQIGDQTWENATADPRIAVLIDRGRDWNELAGARVQGVGELLPAEHPDLREPMSAWHDKYRPMFGSGGFDRFARDVVSLGFVRVVPARVESWNHAVEP